MSCTSVADVRPFTKAVVCADLVALLTPSILCRDTWHTHGFFIAGSLHTVEHELLPLFSPCTLDGCFQDIVAPPADNLALGPQHVALPWEQRRPVLYFRGSNTGGEYNADTPFLTMHRQRLVLAAQNDSRMDIGLTQHIQCTTPDVCAKMAEVLPVVSAEPESENHRHKYVLVIDGNSYASRLQSALSTGSLIFR